MNIIRSPHQSHRNILFFVLFFKQNKPNTMNPIQRQCHECHIFKVEYDMTKGRNWCKQCTNARDRQYRLDRLAHLDAPVPLVPQLDISQQLQTLDHRTLSIEHNVQLANTNIQLVNTSIKKLDSDVLENTWIEPWKKDEK